MDLVEEEEAVAMGAVITVEAMAVAMGAVITAEAMAVAMGAVITVEAMAEVITVEAMGAVITDLIALTLTNRQEQKVGKTEVMETLLKTLNMKIVGVGEKGEFPTRTILQTR